MNPSGLGWGDEDQRFDVIVLGGGNGCIGFLQAFLAARPDASVAVVEQGPHHDSLPNQRQNWPAQTYSDPRPIRTTSRFPMSWVARCLGGGGAINAVMIHPPTAWLGSTLTPHWSPQASFDYWARAQARIDAFLAPQPAPAPGPITQQLMQVLTQLNFRTQADAHPIPRLDDGLQKTLHALPNAWRADGQRRHAGATRFDWSQVQLFVNTRCVGIDFDPSTQRAFGARVEHTRTGEPSRLRLKPEGTLVLAAGVQTPRLLLSLGSSIANREITLPTNDDGVFVSQPVLLRTRANAEPKYLLHAIDRDRYRLEFHFGMAFYLFTTLGNRLPRLLRWMVLHGYEASVRQSMFRLASLIDAVLGWFGWVTLTMFCVLPSCPTTDEDDGAALSPDAQQSLGDGLETLAAVHQALGVREGTLPRRILRWLTHQPDRDSKQQRDRFVEQARPRIGQCHRTGGVAAGRATRWDGQVYGTRNIRVADVSLVEGVPVSPQMTAYVLGHHVGTCLCQTETPRATREAAHVLP